MTVKTTYFDEDDILVIHLSDKPVVREVSQDWHTHVSFAADGSVVETGGVRSMERRRVAWVAATKRVE